VRAATSCRPGTNRIGAERIYRSAEVVVRPIRNNAGHAAAPRRIEELWEAPEGSEESDELEVLATAGECLR